MFLNPPSDPGYTIIQILPRHGPAGTGLPFERPRKVFFASTFVVRVIFQHKVPTGQAPMPALPVDNYVTIWIPS